MSGSGLSKERLARLHEVMAGHVEGGRVPGLVTVVARRGEAHVDAIGTLAAGGEAPVRRDTNFRIASLTKPVTAAAAMILVEECVLRLDDPVDDLLPELADRTVLRAVDSSLDDTVPADRPLTPRDLLTFRHGIGAILAPPGQYPVQRLMDELGLSPGADLLTHPPDELMRRYGQLPLLHQPGEGWLYDSGSNILGVLIARASGQTLGTFLGERIFAPLGMKDTGFSVPEKDLDRFATCYQTDPATGGLALFDEARGGRFAQPPAFEAGSGGLVSTADDYLAFGQMMLNTGTHDGRRILSRPSVELMTTDHLTPEQRAAGSLILDGHRGWGFGLAVDTRRDDLASHPGRYGWDGGYGTSWANDPSEDLVGILLTQRVMDAAGQPDTFRDFWTAAYAAIDD